MRSAGVVVFALALAACSARPPSSPSPGPLNQEVTLAPGQTATITGAALSVRFDGVSGDSRCPADAICITGGDALVQIDVLPAGAARQAYTLHTGDMRPVAHGDLTIALIELSPYPFSARPISPSDYRARIRVSR